MKRTLCVPVWLLSACAPDAVVSARDPDTLSRSGVTSVETFDVDPWPDGLAAASPLVADVDGDGWDDLVGSEAAWSNPAIGEGGVAVWFGGAAGFPTIPDLLAEGGVAGASLGAAAFVGDTDGDGLPEVASPSVSWSGAFAYEGRLELRPLDRTGVGAPVWTGTGGASSVYFGTPALGFDANGDGYADLAVGTEFVNTNTGGARVWYGGPNGLAALPDWSVAGIQRYSDTGRAIATGDLDADGYDDLLVAAPKQLENNVDDAGRVWWFRGGPNGLRAQAAWSSFGSSVGQNFGWTVRVLPDVDGDGYPELAVSSPYWGGTGYNGRVEVFRGGPTGPATAPAWTFTGAAMERLGEAIGVGDPNGDGNPDLLLGTLTRWVREQVGEGSGGVNVVLGVPGGFEADPAYTLRCQTADTCDTPLVVDREQDGHDEIFLSGYLYQQDRALTVVPGGPDADRDGATDGVDCGPTDPDTYLGADELWYDGVDQDCEGGDDWDRDGDGVRVVPRGPDGDDTNTRIQLHLAVTGSCTSTLGGGLWGATPGGRVRLFFGHPGSGSVGADPDCPNAIVDLNTPMISGPTVTAPLSGPQLRGGLSAARSTCGGAFQALDLTTCKVSEAVPSPP